MQKQRFTVLLFVVTLAFITLAQADKPAKKASGSAPDKAYMQKIWDAWSTLDADKAAPYYAQGEHTFYDMAPLKYNSWSDYKAGVAGLLSNYKSATLTVNDDAVGSSAWRPGLGHRHHQRRRGHQDRQARNGDLPLDGDLGKARWKVGHRARPHIRTACSDVGRTLLSAAFDLDRDRGSRRIKINVNSGGQECPPYMSTLICTSAFIHTLSQRNTPSSPTLLESQIP